MHSIQAYKERVVIPARWVSGGAGGVYLQKSGKVRLSLMIAFVSECGNEGIYRFERSFLGRNRRA